MAGLGNLFQKAVYLGIGLASYTGEKVTENLAELRTKAQELTNELVERGEITAEEARRMVDELVQRQQIGSTTVSETTPNPEPRRIEIVDEDEETPGSTPSPSNTKTQSPASPSKADEQLKNLRQQVAELQDELKRLQNP